MLKTKWCNFVMIIRQPLMFSWYFLSCVDSIEKVLWTNNLFFSRLTITFVRFSLKNENTLFQFVTLDLNLLDGYQLISPLITFCPTGSGFNDAMYPCDTFSSLEILPWIVSILIFIVIVGLTQLIVFPMFLSMGSFSIQGIRYV